MTVLITQRTSMDCAVACLAMLLGLSYEDVLSQGSDDFKNVPVKGATPRQIKLFLEGQGLVNEVDFKTMSTSPHWCSLGFARNMLWGRRSMVQVRSKNSYESYHFVYWDGKDLFDPSSKQRYDDWSEVEPMEMWILDETRKTTL